MFTVGDRVKNQYTENPGEVFFGPFEAVSVGTSYLVKLLAGPKKGKVAVWAERTTSTVPKFQVGDQVELASVQHKVVAGPFNSGSRDWYVLENKHGHTTCSEDMMFRVPE